ncbi:hypothetical protein [Bacillus paramycoides]|uniref:hypothetical protein n=1 Tax=Bacillus paramycoides TaxID=2026194 RepID=UPI002E200751|nr:hypothetical protein [Bacillus paramycoides]
MDELHLYENSKIEIYRGRDYVKIGEIQDENCIYKLKQTFKDPTLEESTKYDNFVADLLFNKLKHEFAVN